MRGTWGKEGRGTSGRGCEGVKRIWSITNTLTLCCPGREYMIRHSPDGLSQSLQDVSEPSDVSWNESGTRKLIATAHTPPSPPLPPPSPVDVE